MIKLDDKKTLIISIALSLILLIGGLTHMLSQWNYYENGHDILAIIYAICCLGFFFAMRFVNIAQIISIIILLGLTLFYADQKFQWQKSYFEDAKSGNHFILNSYIKKYPTLESYKFGGLWGEPRWVQLADECIKPELKGQKAAKNCKSHANIKDHYNIDVRKLVNDHFTKMKRTAQKIESGKMKSKRQYQNCLTQKTCAIIPLLPANVDPSDIDADSQDHLLTRKMFWSLINDPKISPEICEFVDVCRTFRDLGVMPITKPKNL